MRPPRPGGSPSGPLAHHIHMAKRPIGRAAEPTMAARAATLLSPVADYSAPGPNGTMH